MGWLAERWGSKNNDGGDSKDLRGTRRIPLTFRPVTHTGVSPQRYGNIVDISPLGMCFLTRNGAVVGETLQMFLRLPKDVIGKPSPEWCWTGRVVRVTPLADRFFEIGVRFVGYDEAKEPSDLEARHAKEQHSTQIVSAGEPAQLSAKASDHDSEPKHIDGPAKARPRTWTKCIVVP
jgi:hypothetical protein